MIKVILSNFIFISMDKYVLHDLMTWSDGKVDRFKGRSQARAT